jgi:predicted transcriptional regulator
VRTGKLSWNLQVRSSEPDPFRADVVHVREDRCDGAGLAGRFGSPCARVKMFYKNLVHALISGKYLDCGSAELRVNLSCVSLLRVNLPSVNLLLTRGHGSVLLDLYYFRAAGGHHGIGIPLSQTISIMTRGPTIAAAKTNSGAEGYVKQLVEHYLDHNGWFRQQVKKGLDQLDRGEFLTHEEVGPASTKCFTSRYTLAGQLPPSI